MEPGYFTNSIGMRFVYIKSGSFIMGSSINEQGRNSDERLHNVTLTNGFYMQTTEVTQYQWKSVMESNPARFKGDDLPVENVSWNDVQEEAAVNARAVAVGHTDTKPGRGGFSRRHGADIDFDSTKGSVVGEFAGEGVLRAGGEAGRSR